MGVALASSTREELAVISPFRFMRFSDPHALHAISLPKVLLDVK
jgi:hypothetical protein